MKYISIIDISKICYLLDEMTIPIIINYINKKFIEKVNKKNKNKIKILGINKEKGKIILEISIFDDMFFSSKVQNNYCALEA